MDLISTLTQNLGVSESQATGGAGLLFKLAKDKLPAGDFAKVASAVPGDFRLGANDYLPELCSLDQLLPCIGLSAIR
jgi:hypothetical protein